MPQSRIKDVIDYLRDSSDEEIALKKTRKPAFNLQALQDDKIKAYFEGVNRIKEQIRNKRKETMHVNSALYKPSTQSAKRIKKLRINRPTKSIEFLTKNDSLYIKDMPTDLVNKQRDYHVQLDNVFNRYKTLVNAVDNEATGSEDNKLKLGLPIGIDDANDEASIEHTLRGIISSLKAGEYQRSNFIRLFACIVMRPDISKKFKNESIRAISSNLQRVNISSLDAYYLKFSISLLKYLDESSNL